MKSIDVSTCLPKQKRPQNAASFIGHDPGLRYRDQFMDRVHEITAYLSTEHQR